MTTQPRYRDFLRKALQILASVVNSIDSILRFLNNHTGSFDVYLFLSYVFKGFVFYILASVSYALAGLVLFCSVLSRGREDKLDKMVALGRTDAERFKTLYEDNEIELPPWITFPDIERADWLTKILQQLWPNVEEYVKDFLKYSLQPELSKRFIIIDFSKIHLGDTAPIITGVKVYESSSRHRITMDVNIVFAGNNSFEVSFSGVKFGIKELELAGQMRIIITPVLNQLPFIGGFQVFFLRNPVLNFEFTKIAKPLETFKEVLGKLILEKYVFPNKFSSLAVTNNPATLYPMPVGVIRITSVRAEKLSKKTGRSSNLQPHCTITLRRQTHETSPIRGTSEPNWNNLSYEFLVEDKQSEVVEFEVYHKNEHLGSCELDVQQIYEGLDGDNPIQLIDASSGLLYIKAIWFDLEKENISFPTAVLVVWVDSVINLDAKPNPIVRLRVGDQSLDTREKQKANNPVFEEDFSFFVKNPRTQKLELEVIDQKTGQLLGELKFSIDNLLREPNLEVKEQNYKLDGSSASILLDMSLRIMKPRSNADETRSGTTIEDVSATTPEECTEPLAEVAPVEEGMPSPATPLMQVLPTASPSEDGTDAFVTTPVESTNLLAEFADTPEEVADPPAEVAPVEESMQTSPLTTSSDESSASTAEMHGLSRIQLTVEYEQSNLIIGVHQIENLPKEENGDLPNPYVKLYLLPDRAKDSKQKTKVIKQDCNPKYNERFEYDISSSECTRHTFEVLVINKRGPLQHSTTMGKVILVCSTHDSSNMPRWYNLEAPAVATSWRGSFRRNK
ncbi:extended synaptotagmin-1-like isoform X1 [Penaeus japonicus]|uniref:extended synaptotagmin-1-like isoform X1 n=1 Tax=Penaeus japonicus TaxID=27405 RepID=UPI001C71728F|nr:extended synaptotagmin-1-like isoform X1 [Penaeus japonicus]